MGKDHATLLTLLLASCSPQRTLRRCGGDSPQQSKANSSCRPCCFRLLSFGTHPRGQRSQLARFLFFFKRTQKTFTSFLYCNIIYSLFTSFELRFTVLFWTVLLWVIVIVIVWKMLYNYYNYPSHPNLSAWLLLLHVKALPSPWHGDLSLHP